MDSRIVRGDRFSGKALVLLKPTLSIDNQNV